MTVIVPAPLLASRVTAVLAATVVRPVELSARVPPLVRSLGVSSTSLDSVVKLLVWGNKLLI